MTAVVGDDLVALLVQRGDELDAQEFSPLRWAVDGLVPEGLGILGGAPKVGKSWFVLDVLLRVALGEKALGLDCGPPRPVLYLALEDGGRRMQERCRLLLGGTPIPSNFCFATTVTPIQSLTLLEQWIAQHGHSYPLIVVDTFAKVRRAGREGESTYSKDYADLGHFKWLVDSHPGITILLVHHIRKMPADDYVATLSGSFGLSGAADFTAVLVRGRAENSAVLNVTGRDIPDGAYALRFADGVWALDGAGLTEAANTGEKVRASAGLGDRSAAVVAFVAEHPDGVRPKDVADALGMSNDDAGKYLRRLVEADRITSLKRGHYAPVRSVRSSELDRVGHSDGSDTHLEAEV